MHKFGLESCDGDRFIYIRRTGNELTIVITHVDDSFVASTRKEVLVDIATHLGNNFTISSVPQTRYVGLNIHRDRKRIFLSQSHMIEKLCKRSKMSDLPRN